MRRLLKRGPHKPAWFEIYARRDPKWRSIIAFKHSSSAVRQPIQPATTEPASGLAGAQVWQLGLNGEGMFG